MDEKKAVADLEAILSNSLSECELVDLLKQAIEIEIEKRSEEDEYQHEDRYTNLVSDAIRSSGAFWFSCIMNGLRENQIPNMTFKILDEELCEKFEYMLSVHIVNVIYNRYKRNLKRCQYNRLFNVSLSALIFCLDTGTGVERREHVPFDSFVNYNRLG
jgi:hypothetical protein